MSDLNNSELSELRDENVELQKTVHELSILNDISAAISSARTSDETERLIIKKCIKYLNH